MRNTTPRVRRLATALALAGLGALATACTESTNVPRVASVVVTPDVVSLQTGETAQLTAAVLDAAGEQLVRKVVWSSSAPTLATVDDNGLVTGLAAGAVTITATSDQKSGTAALTVDVRVAAVNVAIANAQLEVGDTEPAQVTVKDLDGNAMAHEVSWTSSNPAVATVDAHGVVTAAGTGTATISATAHDQTGAVTVTVVVPAASVLISGTQSEPLEVGLTLQLTAVVKDAAGNTLDRPVTWTSANPDIATVDANGLVTGVGRGTVTITATAGKVSATASVRVVGESTVAGNNLSWPVVFAEGIGIGGTPLADGTGLRPLAAEGIVADTLPFWYDGNAPDYDTYYMQQGPNVWQAEWTDGTPGAPVRAQAAFGDNLIGHTWNTHSQIRIEVTLYDYTGPQLTGFNMTVLYGSGETEMQGADGTTASITPTIYAVTPRLVIQKLDDDTREPVYTAVDQSIAEAFASGESKSRFGAEVNVSGKIVYGYNLTVRDLTLPVTLHKYGWWRITFKLDNSATVGGVAVNRNVRLEALAAGNEAPTYPPQIDPATNTAWVDVNIESASGGH